MPKHVAIGIPGLWHESERTGLDDLARRDDIHYLRPIYSAIERKGDTIICPLSIQQYIRDIKQTYQKAQEIAQGGPIGIVASSMGAAMASYFLGQENPDISWFIARAPFIKTHPDLERKAIACQKQKRPLEISMPSDKEAGKTRVVPYESIEEARNIDCIEALQGKTFAINTLTMMGTEDERANVTHTREYHSRMGGTEETFHVYPTGHLLPPKDTWEKMNEFITAQIENPTEQQSPSAHDSGTELWLPQVLSAAHESNGHNVRPLR